MTAFETVMIMLGIMNLFISFSHIVVALLTLLKKIRKSKKMPLSSANKRGVSLIRE